MISLRMKEVSLHKSKAPAKNILRTTAINAARGSIAVATLGLSLTANVVGALVGGVVGGVLGTASGLVKGMANEAIGVNGAIKDVRDTIEDAI